VLRRPWEPTFTVAPSIPKLAVIPLPLRLSRTPGKTSNECLNLNPTITRTCESYSSFLPSNSASIKQMPSRVKRRFGGRWTSGARSRSRRGSSASLTLRTRMLSRTSTAIGNSLSTTDLLSSKRLPQSAPPVDRRLRLFYRRWCGTAPAIIASIFRRRGGTPTQTRRNSYWLSKLAHHDGNSVKYLHDQTSSCRSVQARRSQSPGATIRARHHDDHPDTAGSVPRGARRRSSPVVRRSFASLTDRAPVVKRDAAANDITHHTLTVTPPSGAVYFHSLHTRSKPWPGLAHRLRLAPRAG